MSTSSRRSHGEIEIRTACFAGIVLLTLASAVPARAVIIDNDLPVGVLGHWSVDIDSGGNSRSALLTAKRLASDTIVTENVLYDYFTYIDIGPIGGAFQLVGSAALRSPQDDDEVSSSGTFIGELGNTIEWTATSHIGDGDLVLTTVFTFRSLNGQPMGRLRLYQYLDEDIEGFTDDVLFTRGTTVNDSFEVFTSDGPQAYGVSQSGGFRIGAGLVSAQFAGWAGSFFDAMRPRITGAGQDVSPDGVVDSLGFTSHPSFGAVRGPSDIVSALAWDVNTGSVNATITTSLGGTPDDRTPVEPPVTDKPKEGETTVIGGIDRSRPTVVLTHGLEDETTSPDDLWSGNGTRQAAALIDQYASNDVNLIQYVWNDGFRPFEFGLPTTSGYLAARESTTAAATLLAEQLVDLLGDDYSRSIHMIGHGLGSIVNAYALRQFLDTVPSVTTAQFTSLDRPHHVSDFVGISVEEEDALGFDEDFFAGVLPLCRPGLSLLVDNYFSHDGRTARGLGDRASGPVYNHPDLSNSKTLDNPVFLNEGIDNNHDGIQQWYRWTMRTRSPIPLGDPVCTGNDFTNVPPGVASTLNPCRRGFAWSLNGDLTFPDRPACEGEEPERQELEIPSLRDFGCRVEGTGAGLRVICERETSTVATGHRGSTDAPVVVFGTGPVTIPTGSQYLEFEYEFDGNADSYATVLVDNFILWKGTALSNTGPRRTPPIPIDQFTGNRIVTMTMYGPEGTQDRFTVSGVRTFAAPVCGDGTVDAGEICDDGPFQTGRRCGQACGIVQCGDADDSGLLTVSDAQFVLFAAVGGRTCDARVCDIDSSGVITTSDALTVLRGAVGLSVTRACPTQ